MKNILYSILLLTMFAACSKDENHDFENMTFQELYGGRPYRGTAKAIITGVGATEQTIDGDGRIVLMDETADSVSLVFLADFGKTGEVNMKLRGKQDGNSFRVEGDNIPGFFRVSNESIQGNIDNPIQTMKFAGTLKREQGILQLEVYFKEATESFPQGSSLKLHLETSRKLPQEGDDTSGCQTRVVPIWGPNGMTMGIVPDC